MDIIIDHGPLKREVYTFWFANEFHIYFDRYRLEAKETTRHKFKTIKNWERIDGRNNNIQLSEIKFDDEIKQRAKDQLMKQVQIGLWPERN